MKMFPQVGTHNPDCRRCELGGSARNTCIPTTPYSCMWPRSNKQALLIVAQAPGVEEDRVGRNFVGPSGIVLQNVYLGKEVPALADIFLGNTVRCYFQPGTTVKPAWMKACRTYLQADVSWLTVEYERVVVLCLGAVAAKAMTGETLKKAMSSQGAPDLIGKLPTFSTFHPAYIMYREGDDKKGCKPQYIGAVGSHLTLLRAHLEGRDVRSVWTENTPDSYLEPPI